MYLIDQWVCSHFLMISAVPKAKFSSMNLKIYWALSSPKSFFIWIRVLPFYLISSALVGFVSILTFSIFSTISFTCFSSLWAFFWDLFNCLASWKAFLSYSENLASLYCLLYYLASLMAFRSSSDKSANFSYLLLILSCLLAYLNSLLYSEVIFCLSYCLFFLNSFLWSLNSLRSSSSNLMVPSSLRSWRICLNLRLGFESTTLSKSLVGLFKKSESLFLICSGLWIAGFL